MAEAALAGAARLEGRPVVLISLEFDFLAGTMGSVVGEKVARAFKAATRRRLPVISILASGGARIQEGMLALMQMAKTAIAVAEHHAAQLPYISVLTNPSFGGTFASFGSLGDILIGGTGRPDRHSWARGWSKAPSQKRFRRPSDGRKRCSNTG